MQSTSTATHVASKQPTSRRHGDKRWTNCVLFFSFWDFGAL